MQVGSGLPHAGAAANGPDIIRFAQRAEALGFESSWSGDHIVLPVAGTTQYPYTTDGSFARPTTEGFLEPYTLLAYVAAATKTIKDPSQLTISLKRALHFTDIGLTEEVLSRSSQALIGTTQEVIDDIRRCQDIGIQQLTFDYRTGRVDDMLKIIRHFGGAVVPAVGH